MSFRQSFTVNNLRNFNKEVQVLSAKLISHLERLSVNRTPVEIDTLFGQLTIDVICSVAFQYDISAMENSQEFQDVHQDLANRFESRFFHFLPLAHILIHLPLKIARKYKQMDRNLNKFCAKLLKHLRDLESKGTLRKESFGFAVLEFGKLPGVTESDLVKEIYVTFFAGHDTTSHTMSWFIYALATHPEIQMKCQQEIDSHVQVEKEKGVECGGGDKGLTISLPAYVEAVLKESFRKYPVANRSMRLVEKEEGLVLSKDLLNKRDPNITRHWEANLRQFDRDIVIPKGTWVVTYTHNIHNSPSNWGDRAGEFVSERFMPEGDYLGGGMKSDSQTVNPLSSQAIYGGGGSLGDDLSFTPFSTGMRNCIGMNLALMEIRVALSDVLRQFSFELTEGDMEDENIACETNLTLQPLHKLPVFVTKRTLVSSANAELFQANPIAYYPQYGGYCAWGLTGYDSHVTDPSGFAFGGACVTSKRGFQFTTVDSKLQNVWYLCYEAKHDMNLAGAGDLSKNMVDASRNFQTIVDDNYLKTGSKYCFNTNNIQSCV
eukprot:gene25005-31408_t